MKRLAVVLGILLLPACAVTASSETTDPPENMVCAEGHDQVIYGEGTTFVCDLYIRQSP